MQDQFFWVSQNIEGGQTLGSMLLVPLLKAKGFPKYVRM